MGKAPTDALAGAQVTTSCFCVLVLFQELGEELCGNDGASIPSKFG